MRTPFPLRLLSQVANAPTVARRLEAAQAAVDTAEALLSEACRVRRQAISEARAENWTLQAIGECTGLSKTRIAQLLATPDLPAAAKNPA